MQVEWLYMQWVMQFFCVFCFCQCQSKKLQTNSYYYDNLIRKQQQIHSLTQKNNLNNTQQRAFLTIDLDNPMKTRHGMEIKQLLQQKRLSKSRFNQQSQLSVHNHDTKSVQKHSQSNLKKNDSAASLHSNHDIQHQHKPRNPTSGLQKLQQRYKQLYQQYLRLVQQQKTRTQLCRRQSQQIGKYEKAAQRDHVQIQRLRSLMGFVNKIDYATQTTQHSGATINESKSRNGNNNRGDNSNSSNSSGKLRKSRQQLGDNNSSSYESEIILAKPLLLEKNLLINNDTHHKTTHQQQRNINDFMNGVNLKDVLLKDNANSSKAIISNSSKREINYFKKSRVKDNTNGNSSSYSAIVMGADNNHHHSKGHESATSKGKKQRKQSMSLSNNNNSISVVKPVYSANVSLSSKKQLQHQKWAVKKHEFLYQVSSPQMAESLLNANKSTTNDLRKRRTQPPATNNTNTRTSQLFSQHSNQLITKQPRANSPNSKYKFIPSVDI